MSWRANCSHKRGICLHFAVRFPEIVMKRDNSEARTQNRKKMRSVKLPDKSFKVRFKIFRFGFTDFDVFARHFTESACWQITTHNERTHTYTFQNDWNITLHPHGDISPY